MKRGFTLVELAAVVIILGVVGLIALISVSNRMKDNKEELYKDQLIVLRNAAENWSISDPDNLPDENIQRVVVTLDTLKESGFIDDDFINPLTDELFPDSFQVVITYVNGNYRYEVNESTSDSDSIPEIVDNTVPTLTAKSENIVITKGASINTSEYFNAPVFGTTGGTLSCNPNNTSSLEVGTHTITCTATGNNGKSTTATKTIVVDYEQIINYTMLYDNGDECIDITGGWSDGSRTYSEKMSVSDGSSATHSGSTYTLVKTNNLLNFNGYNGYILSMSLTKNGGSDSKIAIGFGPVVENGGIYDYAFSWTDYSEHSRQYLFNRFSEPISNMENRSFSYFLRTNWFNIYITSSTITSESEYLSLRAKYGLTNSASYFKDFTAKIYDIVLFKPDNIDLLSSVASITANSIDEVLTNSSTLLNNEAAVKYMIKQCTGDFMVSAINNSSFMTALASSPYKDLVYANTHWAKFLNMVQ